MTGCLEIEEGLSPLVEAEWLRPLKLLALNRNGLDDDAVELLAGSKVLTNLERLELARSEISQEATLAPLQKRFRSGLKV